MKNRLKKDAEKSFGAHLRQLRKKRGMSTQRVAYLCEVADSTYREWEYGREIRGTKAYLSLAQAFQVSLAELILGDRGATSAIEHDLREIEKIVRNIRLKL